MTDQRARAVAYDMVDDWYTKHDDVKASVKQRRELISAIATALADERQLVWEEAAKMAEEKAERSIKGEHLNIPEYNFGYRGGLRGLADEIRLKLYAKAHAGQEG